MIRGLLGLLVFAGVITAAIFFADHPGQVEIVWQGWQVETSVGVLAAAAVLAGLAIALLYWLVSLILDSPRAFLRHRRERRRRAGYRALTRGMVAVAAGDPQEAQRCARRADALLADPPLTLLLSAQAAQLGGDETAAKKFFTAMLDRPEMEFLGLRGLLNQAMRAGDRVTALRLSERAATLRPDTTWVVESLFGLEAREGRWDAALETLAQAVKRRIIPRERARHHRGVILYELSLAALASGDRARGRSLAAQAQGADAGSCRSGSPSRPSAPPGPPYRTCGKGHRKRLADNSPSGSRAGLRRNPRRRATSRQVQELRAPGGAKPRCAGNSSRFGGSGARRAAMGRSAPPPRSGAERAGAARYRQIAKPRSLPRSTRP